MEASFYSLDIDALITAKIVDEIGRICRIWKVKRDNDKIEVRIDREGQIDRLKELPYIVGILKIKV